MFESYIIKKKKGKLVKVQWPNKKFIVPKIALFKIINK